MIQLNVSNETALLRHVVLGTAEACGPTPTAAQAYDPKSLVHILAGTYPAEADMVPQMESVCAVLEKHGVTVHRPQIKTDVNQIFARDIGFVIEDKLFRSNIIDQRAEEFDAVRPVLQAAVPDLQVIEIPNHVSVEGGDVLLDGDAIFVGTYSGEDFETYMSCRTNTAAVDYLQAQFPNKTVRGFDLIKSNTDGKANVLHLDCCFQPVGRGGALLCADAFVRPEDAAYLRDRYGAEHVFALNMDQVYDMKANLFSISPEVVISDQSFTEVNAWLTGRGIQVETVDYSEISKQGGLFRCSTLPLQRS